MSLGFAPAGALRHRGNPGQGARLRLPSSGRIGHIEIFANAKPIVTIEAHIGHVDDRLDDGRCCKLGPCRAGHDGEWTMNRDDSRRSSKCAEAMDQSPCPFP